MACTHSREELIEQDLEVGPCRVEAQPLHTQRLRKMAIDNLNLLVLNIIRCKFKKNFGSIVACTHSREELIE